MSDVSLDLVHLLPTRMYNWAREHGVETLRALASIPPEELAKQRNIGRTSIAGTRAVIEARLGARWDDLCRGGPARLTAQAPRPAPPAGGDVSLDAVRLPTRMIHWADRNGVETLEALARIPPGDLLRERNLGRRSIRQTRAVIEQHYGALWESLVAPPPGPSPEQLAQVRAERLRREEALLAATFLDALRTLVAELPQKERIVTEDCTGLVGPARRKKEMARRFGVEVPAIYVWFRQGVDRLQLEDAWMAAVRARTARALADGAVPLETLATDPWWQEMAARPDLLDWFGPRLVGDLHVIELDGARWAARISATDLEKAWLAVRRACFEVPLPAPLDAFHALLDPLAARLGPRLISLLRGRIDALLLVEESTGPEGVVSRVFRVGIPQIEATRLLLEASAEPVHVRDLDARLGSWRLPDEAILLGRGKVGLECHFPDFAGWSRRLLPAALRVMRRGPPDRQWSQHEVHEALRAAQALPDWLGPWHVGSLLRRSGKVRWVGQLRFTLPDAPEPEARVSYESELVRILREAGGPLSRGDLQRALERRASVREATFAICLASAPFLHCGRRLYGLLARDLPGGPESIAPAVEHIVALLDRLGHGLCAAEVVAHLCALGDPYPGWTPEMSLSALATDPRLLRGSAGESIGLRAWGEPRVPTRRDLLSELLDQGGGRAPATAVLQRIEAVYRRPLRRWTLPVLAGYCGAEVQGSWVVRKAGVAA